ncbi:hypothetical protein F0T03_17565 [Yersinia canariae]|uniref:Uncharacterized protein n=1 Tax=Yersinia canariae TaxID=2607663 RepID=A0A857F4A9_9GAMM|nr:hypothetical protein F0T03_17565 [Yersinia canariae]
MLILCLCAQFFSIKLCTIPLSFVVLIPAIAYFSLWLPDEFGDNVGKRYRLRRPVILHVAWALAVFVHPGHLLSKPLGIHLVAAFLQPELSRVNARLW